MMTILSNRYIPKKKFNLTSGGAYDVGDQVEHTGKKSIQFI